MREKRRWFSLFLVACMLVSLLGSGAEQIYAVESTEEYVYIANEDGTHKVYLVDEESGKILITESESCKYEDGYCSLCKFEQALEGHQHDYSYTDNGDGTHTVSCTGCSRSYATSHGECDENGICKECGGQWKVEDGNIYESNANGTHRVINPESGEEIEKEAGCTISNGMCIYCGYKPGESGGTEGGGESGDITPEEYVYIPNEDGTHKVYLVDEESGKILIAEGESCKYEDGYCSLCKFEQALEGHQHDYSYTDNGDGTHTVSCTGCSRSYATSHGECDENGICKECGGQWKVEDGNIYESNANGTHRVINPESGEEIEKEAGCTISNGMCIYCGYKPGESGGTEGGGESGDVTKEEYVYIANEDGTHKVYLVDEESGKILITESESCKYEDGYCSLCKFEQALEGHQHDYSYTDNGDGTHTVSCTGCSRSYATSHGECDENGICKECGGQWKVEDGNIYESNANGTHRVINPESGEEIEKEADCTISNGMCIYCGYKPESSGGNDEPEITYEYQSNGNGTHTVYSSVDGKLEVIDKEAVCEYKEGYCKYCGHEEKESEHEHKYSYADNGDGTHHISCSGCDEESDETHSYKDKICIYCGAVEEKEEHEHKYSYADNGDGTHHIVCSGCDEESDETHSYKDKICIYCGVEEEKEEVHTHAYSYTDIGNGVHKVVCEGCGIATNEAHSYNTAGMCTLCGSVKEIKKEEEVHTHTFSYTDSGNGVHVVTCADCGTSYTEAHTYDALDCCTLCGSIKEVNAEHVHEFEYIDNEDGTHTISCTDCDYTVTEKHAYDGNGICKVCDSDKYAVDIEEAEPEITEIMNVQKGILLSWDYVDGSDGYYIYRKVGKEKWKKVKATTETSWTDAKASKNGEKYQYKICAYQKKKLSAESEIETMYRLVKKNIAVAKNLKGKKLKLKWQANAKGNGYQIQYATDENFKGAKKVTVSGSKKKETTVKGLKKGNTYFVRMRSYKKVGKKTYYSDWSNVKEIKIKK